MEGRKIGRMGKVMKRDGRIVKLPAWDGTGAVIYDESQADFH